MFKHVKVTGGELALKINGQELNKSDALDVYGEGSVEIETKATFWLLIIDIPII
jgi:hypothetical protein